jgi:hypothetical protein
MLNSEKNNSPVNNRQQPWLSKAAVKVHAQMSSAVKYRYAVNFALGLTKTPKPAKV